MLKIFIVEDDLDILALMIRIFTFRGNIILDTAQNGEAAIDKYKKLTIKPDIVIMDYHMPVLNGFEASKKILEFDPSANIIMFSSDSTIKEEALSLGIKTFYNTKVVNKKAYNQFIWSLLNDNFNHR